MFTTQFTANCSVNQNIIERLFILVTQFTKSNRLTMLRLILSNWLIMMIFH